MLIAAAAAALPAAGWSTTAHADQLGSAPSQAATVSYFNWVDHASAGMTIDNIHLLDPSSSPSSGRIVLPGIWEQPFSVPAGGEAYYGVPDGVIGGPLEVVVDSGAAVIASQRVKFMGTISEVPALALSAALSQGWFSWYDHASPGMNVDNIHLLNLGASVSSGQITLPGATPIAFSIGAGQEAYYSFPSGVIGGPLSFSVASGPPLIASQRVAYLGSFSETPALDPSAAATQLWFNWYDRASQGVNADDIHIVNPGTSGSSGYVSAPGLASIPFSVDPGSATHISWPQGSIGGPVSVNVTAGPGVLATQRLSLPPIFQEWSGLPPAAASNDAWFNWYDLSTALSVDDVHVLNPFTVGATVSLQLGGAPAVKLQVPAGANSHYTFPAGTASGPLHVQVVSGPPVLASQRAWLVPLPSSRVLNVPYYRQGYSLSCEEAALRMALAWEGVAVSEDDIFNVEGIDRRSAYWDSAGNFHWGDPYDNFVGNPNGSEVALTGYGTYWTTIQRAATALGGTVLAAGEGIQPADLYTQVLLGHPVIAWISFDYRYRANSHYTAFDGDYVQFGPGWEHAVTVIGVTPDSVLVNDPWNGQAWHSRAEFESTYATFNQMAVVLK